MKLGTSIASLVLLGTACSVAPDPAGSAGERAQAVIGADGPAVSTSLDRAVHPTPGEPSGSQCGPRQCADGQLCCNESFGLCVPHGGICLQRQCGPTTLAATECTDDGACRAISSYCDGCQCLAGGALDPPPLCHATQVACILDPCHHQHAACVNGTCSIVRN